MLGKGGKPDGPPDLGVLFVHGIGTQAEGDTLSSWADALIKWLRDWLGPDRVRTGETKLRSGGNRQGQAYLDLEVHLRETGNPNATWQRWRLAESWWAEAFHQPRFSELAFWGFAVLPWVALAHFRTRVERSWRNRRHPGQTVIGPILGWTRLILEVAYLLLAIALSPVLAGLVLVMVLLALLPIRFLRQAAVAIQRLLARTLGDSYVLLGSPSREASIVSRVGEDVHAMGDCGGVVVIAHSQGAAVAYKALRRFPLGNLRKFISFGSGQTKLEALEATQQTRAYRMAWLAPLGFLYIPILAIQAIDQIRQGDSDSLFALAYIALFALAIVVTGLNATKLPTPADGQLAVGASEGWLDIYASHDPVSNGPVFGVDDARGELERPKEISNYASASRDHTGYWRNRDEFLPIIASELASVARRSIDRPNSLDAAFRSVAVRRRRFRIRALRVVRLLAVGTLAAALLGYADRLPTLGRWLITAAAAVVDRIPLVSWDPRGMAETQFDAATGIIGVIVLVASSYAAVAGVSHLWEASDFQHFVGREMYPLWAPQLVAGIYLVIALLALALMGPRLPRPTLDLGWLFYLLSGPVLLLLVGGFLYGISRLVGSVLRWVGLIRPGHSPLSTGEIAALLVPWWVTTLVLDALPNPRLSTWAIILLVGLPVIAIVGPPLLSSSRWLAGLLRPLRMLAVAEPVWSAVLREDKTAPIDETLIVAANTLRARIEQEVGKELQALIVRSLVDQEKGRAATASDQDLEKLLEGFLPYTKVTRELSRLFDEAAELADRLQTRQLDDVAVDLLSAAARVSPTAAMRLWELQPSRDEIRQLVEHHARTGPFLSRRRLRRVLEPGAPQKVALEHPNRPAQRGPADSDARPPVKDRP